MGRSRSYGYDLRRRPRRLQAHGIVGTRHAHEFPRTRPQKGVPLKQKISEAEAEIARINGIISKIDTALALPDLFTRDPKQAAQLSKARAGAESALQRAEEEWLAASSQYDEATG